MWFASNARLRPAFQYNFVESRAMTCLARFTWKPRAATGSDQRAGNVRAGEEDLFAAGCVSVARASKRLS